MQQQATSHSGPEIVWAQGSITTQQRQPSPYYAQEIFATFLQLDSSDYHRTEYEHITPNTHKVTSFQR